MEQPRHIASAFATLAAAATMASGQSIVPLPSEALANAAGLPTAAAQTGSFSATLPLLTADGPGVFARTLGDTFDTELFVADTPAINLFAFLAPLPAGQSVLGDGAFQSAGTSVLTGFNTQARVVELDLGGGLRAIQVWTRTAQFSDGFLPINFVFNDPASTPINTLGWLVGAPGDRDGFPDPYDPNLSGPFPPAGEFTVVAADLFWFDNGVLLGAAGFNGVPFLNETDFNFFITLDNAAGADIDEMVVQYLVESSNAGPQVTINPVDDCLDAGENQLVVEIDSSGLTDLAVGGQFFLEYDETLLDFVSADVGDLPYSVEIFESVNEANGTIDYAVGVPNGGPGTAVPTTMARITFNTLADFCAASDLVSFRTTTPPSRLTNDQGADLGAAVINLGAVTKDSVPPTIVAPADISMNADAGGCDAIVPMVGSPSASDDCSAVNVTFERSDNPALTLADPFPQGSTTITWTATDACGNSSSDTQIITIDPENDLDVMVELAGAEPGPFDRCITFELIPTGGGTPVVVGATLTFTAGVAAATVEVPCGSYECITARDTLHTLRATDNDDFTIAGAAYVADFTAGAGDNDALVGGNLNDDSFIDILDFGTFIAQFGQTIGADTPCGTSAPHSDISADGDVGSADFTFIQINFLRANELRCDGSLARTAGGTDSRPGTRLGIRPMARDSVTLKELNALGLGHLAVADLNNDRVLDTADIGAFLAGDRPDHLADVNGDGRVTAHDVAIVAEGLIASDATADVNRDGITDTLDLIFVANRMGVVARPVRTNK